MTERGEQLHATADQQITELTGLIQTLDERSLRLQCAGREKLGDGTVAACAQHTADNYRRIAAFVATSDRTSANHTPDSHRHDEPYTAENTSPADLIEQLSGARQGLSRMSELTDRQLDKVPPKDSFRFCDGQRTLEQVLTGLLKHQAHQVRALQAAISSTQ